MTPTATGGVIGLLVLVSLVALLCLDLRAPDEYPPFRLDQGPDEPAGGSRKGVPAQPAKGPA